MNATITNGNENVSRPNDVQALWTRLKANPKIPLLVAASAAVAIVVALLLWAKSPDYRVLYSNINDRDAGAIVAQLTQMAVPYRFNNDGSALLIPTEKVHETRLKLAQQGLPRGGSVGFELMDEEKFGISQFSEQINYQRALEGELSRTIESLGPVHNARVHLALPKPSLFVREQKAPTASVTLTLQPGRALDDGQINAIVYMLSSSVSGLPPSNVTVVDQAGRLLTQSDGTGRDLNASQLKYTSEIENRYQRRIESILAPVVGGANVRVQVTAQVDFATREQTDEQYQPNQDPKKSAVRSKQISQSDQRGAQQVGGVPGALSNQPVATATAPIDASAKTQAPTAANAENKETKTIQSSSDDRSNVPQSKRHDETVNYELDRTIRHTQQKAGTVERLSVAVVLNTITDEKGDSVPMPEEQMTKLEGLVREAMGYSENRGDTLNLVSIAFTEDNKTIETPFWQSPVLINQLLNAGRYLLILLAAWLLWRKLILPQMKKLQAAQEAAALQAANAASLLPIEPSIPSPADLNRLKNAKQRSEMEGQSTRIRTMADDDPRMIALLIRQWMNNEQNG